MRGWSGTPGTSGMAEVRRRRGSSDRADARRGP